MGMTLDLLKELALFLPPNSQRPEYLVEYEGKEYRFVKYADCLQEVFWDYDPPDNYMPHQHRVYVVFSLGKKVNMIHVVASGEQWHYRNRTWYGGKYAF